MGLCVYLSVCMLCNINGKVFFYSRSRFERIRVCLCMLCNINEKVFPLVKIQVLQNVCFWTDSGDAEVFRQLQNGLVAALGEHKVEWRRPGHQPCHVTLEAGFEPLTDASLGDDLSSLRSRPCLHTHWLCAVDADVYKSSSRPILLQWLSRLRNANVLDWMVVVVVAGQAMEARAKTAAKLLPRTTVLDRVKQDVLSKHSDRQVHQHMYDTSLCRELFLFRC